MPDPYVVKRARMLELQADPVVVVDPSTGLPGGAVTLKGSNGEQDLRGLIADRPDADAVPVGSTFTAADRVGEANFVSMSDGTTWVNL